MSFSGSIGIKFKNKILFIMEFINFMDCIFKLMCKQLFDFHYADPGCYTYGGNGSWNIENENKNWFV